jgi:hypothetical protein
LIASEWFAYAVASSSTKGTSMGDEVLCIGLLGVFSISVGDSVIADDAWRLRKAKTLIKLLALAPERRARVAGSGLEFCDRGEHELKGIPGRWPLLEVAD